MLSKDKIKTEISTLPQLSSPTLICGMPGSGYVGKLAIDYLIDKLKAEKFADIYSSSFPPQVTIQPDGTIDLIKNSMYFCKIDGSELVFLTGDAQPVTAEAEYALAEEILDICKKVNVNRIYTLAAYITGKFLDTPKVHGTSTSREIIKEFSKYGVSTMNKGSITGMNGVIIGAGKVASIDGICLLGETSGYVIDAKASKAVLDALCKMLNLSVDMSDLKKRAEDTEQIIKSIAAQAASQAGSGGPEKIAQDEKRLDYIS